MAGFLLIGGNLGGKGKTDNRNRNNFQRISDLIKEKRPETITFQSVSCGDPYGI